MHAEFLRISDVSRVLQIPYQRLFVAVVSGKIPAHRDPTGNRWLIDEADLPKIREVVGGQTDTEIES